MPRRFYALITLLPISLGIMVLALISGGSIEQVLVLPLVVALPGFAVMAALFPHTDLPVAEQVLLSLGLSLVVLVLSGLLLNLTPWGLQTASWVIAVGSITLGAAGLALALARQGQGQGQGQGRPGKPWSVITSFNPGLNSRQIILFSLAGLVVLLALLVARNGALQKPTPGFTQLWLLPGAKVAGQTTLRLGFSNQEGAEVTYKLQIKSGADLLQEWPALTLKPLEQWETNVTLPPGLAAGGKVEALLYKASAPDIVYRQVDFNLP